MIVPNWWGTYSNYDFQLLLTLMMLLVVDDNDNIVTTSSNKIVDDFHEMINRL